MSPASNNSRQSADIVIIGGGVIGLTIARSLALRNAGKVMLIERAQLGTESSFAAAGMLAPQAEADSADDFFRLLCNSRDLYDSFASSLLEETGIDIELDTTGTLYLAFTEDDEQEIRRRYEWQTQAGLPVEQLTASGVCEREPSLNPQIRAALSFPKDVQVENRRLLSALANSVYKLGVKVVTDTDVESLLVDRGRINGVRSARGLISCETVVVSSGCWTNFINITSTNDREVGPADKWKSNVRVEPVRGQMLCFAAKPQLVHHVIYSPRGYLVPRRDGRLLAGSTSERAGYAKQVTAGGMSKILDSAQEIAGTVSSLPLLDCWAGLRPGTVDGLPVLGPCDEIDGLFYATGHYRNGILLAPITGELVAETILSKSVSPLLSPFSPNRFTLVSTS